MKLAKTLFVSILSLGALIGGMQSAVASSAPKSKTEKTDGTPAITFKEKSYDFGYVAEKGGPVTHIFEFKNTGDAPLVIISATASCGCTRPSYTTEPIAPGKKGKIKVTYLPDGRPGAFNKEIKVRTNAKSAKKFVLSISGTVVSAK